MNATAAKVQPYLFFNGRCAEAVEFYRQALGAEVDMLMRVKDSPEPPRSDCGQMSPEAVMHARFRIGNTTIMASDGECSGQQSFAGFALSLDAATEEEAHRLFSALADGGQVQMPLEKTFYSPCFGMLADRFGISWMVIVQAPCGK